MALSANIGSLHAAKYGEIQSYPVAAGVHIYRFATVVIHGAGTHEGYAAPATADTADTLKQLVVGVAQEERDNSASSTDGLDSTDKKLIVRVRQEGKVRRSFPANTVTCVGKLACVVDDETVQFYDAAKTKVIVGRITERIDEQNVFVDFDDRPARLATDVND